MPVAETVGHSTKTDNTLCWFLFHFSTVWDYYVLGDVEDILDSEAKKLELKNGKEEV